MRDRYIAATDVGGAREQARRAVRDGGSTVGEVNDRLRAVFAEFLVDAVAPGIVGVLPVLRDDVIDRFVESGTAAVLAGPEGTKSGDALPPASPVAIFTGEDSLSVRDPDTCASRTTARRSVGLRGGPFRA